MIKKSKVTKNLLFKTGGFLYFKGVNISFKRVFRKALLNFPLFLKKGFSKTA